MKITLYVIPLNILFSLFEAVDYFTIFLWRGWKKLEFLERKPFAYVYRRRDIDGYHE